MPDQPRKSDSETDPGRRSHSQSRRARRRKQGSAKNPKSDMPPVPEHFPVTRAEASQSSDGGQAEAASSSSSKSSKGSAPQSSMPPLEWMSPDGTATDGPVTHARAQRGELPLRQGNPDQKVKTAGGEEKKGSSMMDQDGLKLRLELNLDLEIELKASIHGDITLALL
ncbi:hypothetical protein MMC13_000728 [Lambiella insularis]|nr:hypothetical protein [Lambiella insularis]